MIQEVRNAELGVCVVCGISYHRSPIEVRERISISAERLADALRFLSGQPGVRECMVLSTCNRTEIYLAAPEWLDARELFCRLIEESRSFDMSGVRDQIYEWRGVEAVKHSFRVASSLDSLILGESQILGQFKAAFREAENRGCIDRELHRWIPRVFSVAKQVRSETGICEAAVSISYAAVQLARKIFENLSGKAVILLGAGRMGELAALHLREAGASSIAVANRTKARAEEVAARCSGTVVAFESRARHIAAADIVICSTDAPQYILSRDDIRAILHARSDRPLLILDISVPRNVEPVCGDLDGVYLFNIDDLDSVVQANRRDRETAAGHAEIIVQKSLERFLHEEVRSRMAPSIAEIRDQVRAVCRSELDRFEQRVPDLRRQEREELEVMLHRIAQKILHPVIMELKTMPSCDDPEASPSLAENLLGIGRKTSAC